MRAELIELPTEGLRVSRSNPRRGPGDIEELAASIEVIGMLQPLVVCPDGEGGHVVLAGQRRLAAARRLGWETVPCIVRRLRPEEREVAMLVENVQRVALTPLEEATVYIRLMKTFGLNQPAVARLVGKTQTHISRYLAYLRLPKEVIAACERGDIGLFQALGLGKYRDPDKPRQPQGRKSLHSVEGHRTCSRETCGVARAFAASLVPAGPE